MTENLFTPRKSIMLGIALSLALLGAGCAQQSRTEKVLQYGDDLKAAIEKFEASRTKTLKAVNDVNKATKDEFKVKPVSLSGAAKNWETRWSDVRSKVEALEGSLSEVGKRSEAYFMQLQTNTEAMHSKELKVSESKLNSQLKSKWTKEFSTATNHLAQLRRMLIEGDDFHRMLENAALRRQLQVELNELARIVDEANKVLPLMQKLTEEGRKLSSGG